MSMLIGKIEPGDVVGRCRIIRELGRGGVGTVYLAKHQTLQIEVALKVLSPALSMDNPALAERFIREAQLAARIRHPNVIAVMDAAHDEPTGLYFIVQEYVGGGALSWHLRNGPLPETKALAIITGIAHALVVAEENQIVHRDIKPDNIMLDGRGTAKLADLGLAKQIIDSHTSLTLGGSYMGTPAYMSPEQARDAKAADTRDDIYSLGATLYECLTGHPPFEGETPYNIMSELLTKPSPQPRAHQPEISRSADIICRKMMAKTRSLRYGDPGALLGDLQHAQLFGDAGYDKLEAATFAQDSIMVRQQALDHGVHTSADGVAIIPDSIDSRTGPSSTPFPAPVRARGADRGVFRAAALLLVFVVLTTLIILLLQSGRSLATLQSRLTQLSSSYASSETNPAIATAVPPPHEATPHPLHPKPPVDRPPEITNVTPPRAFPVDLPPENTSTNTDLPPVIPATPVDTNVVGTPALPSIAQSAFEARSVAETSVDPHTVGPTGQADLLKVIGRRNPQIVTPTSWIFYFYDKNATGNAHIITVRNGKVVKNGEDLVVALSPWHTDDILPDDKLTIDSSAALQIAQNLVTGTVISSSEFELLEKDSVPTWRVSLWARDAEGEEQSIGNLTILADTGAVAANNLKPNRAK